MTLSDFFSQLDDERLRRRDVRVEVYTDNWEYWGFDFTYEEFKAAAKDHQYAIQPHEDGINAWAVHIHVPRSYLRKIVKDEEP